MPKKRTPSAEIIEVAKDAFYEGRQDVGAKLLRSLPKRAGGVAVCVRQTHKDVALQQSHYKLFNGNVRQVSWLSSGGSDKAPLPKVRDVVVSASTLQDADGETAVMVASRFGKLKRNASGHLIQVHGGQRGSLSHREALQRAGFETVIPCEGVELSGARTKRKRRR